MKLTKATTTGLSEILKGTDLEANARKMQAADQFQFCLVDIKCYAYGSQIS